MKKRLSALLLAVIMLFITLFSSNGCSTPPTSPSPPSSEHTDFSLVSMTAAARNQAYTTVQDGDISTDTPVNYFDPFGDSCNGIRDKLSSQFNDTFQMQNVCVVKQNSYVYLHLLLNNPYRYKVLSVTINGKEYAKKRFDTGSDYDTVVLYINVGESQEPVKYTLDSISYVDNDGNTKEYKPTQKNTSTVLVVDYELPYGYHANLKTTIKSVSFDIKFIDPACTDARSFWALYDGDTYFKSGELKLGENHIALDNMPSYTDFQLVIINTYKDDSGNTFGYISKSSLFKTMLRTNLSSSEDPFEWEYLDFKGEPLRVLARDDYKASKEWGLYERADIEWVDVEVQRRNEKVKKMLGIDLQVTYVGGSTKEQFNQNLMSLVERDYNSGLNNYDVVACYGFSGMSAAYKDIWANLLDKDTFPYFDFSLPCWNQSLITNGAINNRMYLCAGDMNISMIDSAKVIWHNNDLYEELLEKTNDTKSPKNINYTVIAGEWTYSELYKWASYHGNAEDNSRRGEVFGLYMNGETDLSQHFDSIPYALGVDFTDVAPNGFISYNFKENDTAERAMNSLRKLWSAEGILREATNSLSFTSGNVLFKADVIWSSNKQILELHNMRDHNALIPWPKPYKSQYDTYSTTCDEYFTTMSVIDHSASAIPTKGHAISAYLQCSNEYSYTNIRPYYLKDVIMQKWFGGITDYQKPLAIFNAIINGIEFDFCTIYGPMLDNVLENCWRYNVLLKNDGSSTEIADTTVFQKYEAEQEKYDSDLAALNEWFGLVS